MIANLAKNKSLALILVIVIALVIIGAPLHYAYANPFGVSWGELLGVGLCTLGGAGIAAGTGGLGTAVGMAAGGICAAGVLGGAVQNVLSDVAAELMDIVLIPLASALTGLASYLVVFAGKMLDSSLSADFNEPRNIVNNNFVATGWELVRNFANMFFVIILIIIAFATITRQLGEHYEIKRALPKLIIVALLVNFSRVITGVIIDAAQIAMLFFFDGFREISVGNVLANNLNLAQIGQIHWKDLELGAFPERVLILVGHIVTFFVYIFAAFGLALFAILFIVRVVALWLLIILAPLAFVFSILPATQQFFRMWWNNFIKWALWGVAAGFFLYLALILGGALSEMGFGGEASMGTLDGVVVALMRYAALLILLFMGFNIARTSTDRAGAMVAGKFEGWARGTAGIAARPAGAAVRAARARAAREAEKRAAPPAGRMAAVAAGLSKVPLVGAIPRQLVEPLRRFEARVGKQIDDERRQAESLSTEGIIDVAKTTKDVQKRIGYQLAAGRRGVLDEEHGFTEEERASAQEVAERFGREKELVIVNPQLAPQAFGWPEDKIEENLKSLMSKIKPSEGASMSSEALRDETVRKIITGLMQSGQLRPQHLEAMAKSDNTKLVTEMENKIIKPFHEAGNQFSEAIEKWLNGPGGMASFRRERRAGKAPKREEKP